MRWDQFTVMSQAAIQKAQGRAEEMGHPNIQPDHLLWSFLAQDENIVNAILAKVGAPTARIRSDIEAVLDRLPKVSGGGETVISPDLRRVLDAARKEADELKDEYVSTEHLFLAVLKEGKSGA